MQVWCYALTDKAVGEGLASWPQRIGWDGEAMSYSPDLKVIFPKNVVERKFGTHTCVSFAYSEQKSVYLTVYYSPAASARARIGVPRNGLLVVKYSAALVRDAFYFLHKVLRHT